MATILNLSNYNNCNVIRASGSVVDTLFSANFSNVSSINMTASINNCQVATHSLSFTDTVLTLPTDVSFKTVCDAVQSCSTTLTYSNVFGDLKTPINTGVTLQHTINSTSSTSSFCGVTGTTRSGEGISGITILTSTVSLYSGNVYNNGFTDYSASIKSDIESLLTNNSITYSSVIVTYQAGTVLPIQSAYTISINTTEVIAVTITTSGGTTVLTNTTGCTSSATYGYNHKRSTFVVQNYDSSNTALVKWYTSDPWDYNSATGVYIESYNDTTFNVTYNVKGNITLYMAVTTKDSTNQDIIYSWTLNADNQQLYNANATLSTPHYNIVTGGDTGTIAGTILSGATSAVTAGANCVKYLEILPSFFALTTAQSLANTTFPDGIYSLNITITYKDGTTGVSANSAVFMNCVLKCVVADCVYSTKSYELMTLYNALVALGECDTFYVDEMSELFSLLLSSLCHPIETLTNVLNEDCGCG